ncbi:mannitol dehydrogenase family protein [Martelella radicis]|uniref:Fructuronate reductase n=1 Tax=Martelella radicis TaxID=1397476 RepID=A0A7W6KNQ2_9HYPH|nr:mannitol dehydrogenase family protein [Martelella radicis]MBB4124515.1 fructuronate reductase [Martelella radicis]
MSSNPLLDQAAADVLRPDYDRSKIEARMCHIGFGAFHRAHQAVYTDDVLRAGGTWGYREIELRGPSAPLKALAERDYLYSVVENAADGQKARISGAVVDHRHMEECGSEGIIAAIADEKIALVSITVTEKGYTLGADGGLDFNNPAIKADLENPDQPRSVVGTLVAALAARKRAGQKPFTVLSCDNLPSNGKLARRAVIDFARARDRGLADWIEEHGRFPSTMVDRIVPAMTEESYRLLAERIGTEDPAGIVCEPFRQWVIEDDFVSGRPDWDRAGATFTDDVVPYENMKLRMLNGSHSFLAYLGYLGGYETIAECMQDPAYRKAARDLMGQEQIPTLEAPEGIDLDDYADALITRFENPAIRHRTWQIAMDGSQKLPQRALESIAHHLKSGSPCPRLTLLVAGWIRYVAGTDDKGAPIDVRDPLADRLKTLANGGSSREKVERVLSGSGIFPEILRESVDFRQSLAESLEGLGRIGARKMVAQLG